MFRCLCACAAASAGDRQCTNCRSEGVMRLNADSGGGFMGSVVVDDHHDDNGCGTSRCPWVISGQPGQVSLSLTRRTE